MKLRMSHLQFLYCVLVLFFFTLDISVPFIFYFNLLLSIPLLLIIRFLLLPKVNKKKIVIIYLLVATWEVLTYIQSKFTLYDQLLINTQRSILFFVAMFFIIDLIEKFDLKIILKSINFYIVFNALIIIFQVIGFYILHIPAASLDISQLLGGIPSRNQYGDSLYRPNGIMAEPAAFSGSQIALLTLQFLINKKNNFVRILGLISILASFSFAGFILVFLYSIIVFTKNTKSIFAFIILGIVASLSLQQIFIDRLNDLGSESDGSNQSKIDGLNYFLGDINRILFGIGNVVSNGTTPSFFEGITDVTFFLATYTVYGVIFGTLILMAFFRWLIFSNYSKREKLIILIPLIKLTNPAVMFFCPYIFIIMLLNRKIIR